MTEPRLFTVWIVVRPADDVPGQWVGHCLDIDVVTQGNSAQHAFEMLAEAIAIVAEEDLSTGRDPRDRRRAPGAEWDALFEVVQAARERPKTDVDAENAFVAVVDVQMVPVSDPPLRPKPALRLAWPGVAAVHS
jgi:predicted RNase H-like HicB family nuclease